jgi:hypothetical protein
MSFIYSRALVEASLQGKCSDTDASALLSGSPMPQGFSSPDKTTALSRLSRFGMTFKPLTADLGAALLTSWLAGFPARTSALPAKARASAELDPACGGTWRASLAKFDPATSSWKTAQLSLLEDSELCSVTWPRSGMTAAGQCWERPTLERRTSATGSGLSVDAWPTPRCHMTRPVRVRMDVEKGHKSNLEEVVAVRASGFSIDTDATDLWSATAHGAKGTASVMWPTPTVCGNYNRKGSSATSGDGLAIAVGLTPGGSLNPTWVEWLMGWPLGWTDLKPLGTDKCQPALQQPGVCSQQKTEP